jgi:hypothetical protein
VRSLNFKDGGKFEYVGLFNFIQGGGILNMAGNLN